MYWILYKSSRSDGLLVCCKYDGSYIAEYSDYDNHTAIILKDTRPGTTNVLGFKTGDQLTVMF